MKLSHLAETLIGSEIIRLAADIKEKMAKGQKIYNYTIGDFDPEIFPIPKEFEEAVVRSYREKNTHYPPGDGILELRKAVSAFISGREGMEYDPADEILISGGGRPLIYAAYRAIVDKGEKVIYAVPSWNNNHYTHFVEGEHAVVEATPENNFMPTAGDLKPLLKGATLLALCSPLNPTGTAFSRQQLEEICDLVLEENAKRTPEEKKLFILFDQIYWQLTYGDTVHYHPVGLRPQLKEITIYIDGMSKAFASTGVRVGWALGPAEVIGKMKSILSHIGAWSPMPEQRAASRYLIRQEPVSRYLEHFKAEIRERLQRIYEEFEILKEDGYPVNAIAPQAAIYLTIRLDLKGRKTKEGETLTDQVAVTRYVLDEAGLAVVPFYAFGTSKESPWYRLSVGTCKKEEIDEMIYKLRESLDKLQA
jgi:aspartate aminotransferase